MSIENRVIREICETVGLSKDEVTLESTVDSLGMDSLDTVECIMALEEEFDLEIPDNDAERITSVRQAIDYITPLV
jgi:acyl carrier protein